MIQVNIRKIPGREVMIRLQIRVAPRQTGKGRADEMPTTHPRQEIRDGQNNAKRAILVAHSGNT